MYKPWLYRYSLFVSLSTFFLIIAGGLVTSTGSGLSVPDWPLSYGQFFPPMVGGIRFEHSHRVIAGFVGLLALALMILILMKERDAIIRWFGVAAFLSVVLQAVLGGLTVIYLLPTWISVFHACLGQTFFCLAVSVALFSSKQWRDTGRVVSDNAASLHRLLVITTIFVYLQLIAGSVIRHSANATVKFHIILALLIAMHVLFIVFKTSREEKIRVQFMSHASVLGLLVMFQIFLGFGSFIFIRYMEKSLQPTFYEVLLRTAHQSVGALILAALFTLTLRSFKFVKQT